MGHTICPFELIVDWMKVVVMGRGGGMFILVDLAVVGWRGVEGWSKDVFDFGPELGLGF